MIILVVSILLIIPSFVAAAPCTAYTMSGQFQDYMQNNIQASDAFLTVENVNKGTYIYSNESDTLFIGPDYIQIQWGNVGDTNFQNCYEPDDIIKITGYDNSTNQSRSVYAQGDFYFPQYDVYFILLVSNAPPTIDSVTINLADPTPIDTISCNFSGYADPFTPNISNNNQNVTVQYTNKTYYRWYQNDIFLSENNNPDLDLTGIASVGDTFICSVVVFDGMDNSSATNSSNSATVKDFPLQLKNLSFSQNQFDSAENVTCQFEFVSPSLENITVNIVWDKNGVQHSQDSILCNLPGVCNATLTSDMTQRGEIWNCTIIADTGSTSFGPYSVSTMIQNAVPVSHPVSPESNIEMMTRVPFLRWANVTDNDGDAVQYQLYLSDDSLFENIVFNETFSQDSARIDHGISYSMSTDSLIPGTYFWKVRVHDSIEYGPWSTIQNFTIYPFNQTLHLYKGYNLVSLPVILEDIDTGYRHENLTPAELISYFPADTVQSIVRWDSNNQMYPLPTCLRTKNPFTGDVSYTGCNSYNLTTGQGFYLEVNEDYNLTCIGRPIQTINYVLVKGYNLIGYNNPLNTVSAIDYIQQFPSMMIRSIVKWDAQQKKYPLPACQYSKNPFTGIGNYTGCNVFSMSNGDAYFVEINDTISRSFTFITENT